MVLPPHVVFSLLDLTSLNDTDSPAHIAAFCAKARPPRDDFSASFSAENAAQISTPYAAKNPAPHAASADWDGKTVAAVCVYPAFVAIARQTLNQADLGAVPVATVVNFPSGDEALATIASQTQTAFDDGAGEIDLVLPYRAFLRGDKVYAQTVVQNIAEITRARGGLLKVILETGALENPKTIAAAGEAALESGADFLKTSTGKIPIGATLDAVKTLAEVLRGAPEKGLKISGGVRDMAQARAFIEAVVNIRGGSTLNPKTLRIGASSLRDALFETRSLS